MIKASVAYEMMEKALHLIPSHESNSTYLSAYGVFNLESGDCVAVRAANHGTFLYNWLKMQDKPFNVDLLTSANIAITFLDGSIPFSQNNNIEMDNGAEPPVFVVRQYVYNCAVLDTNDINVIISASKKLIVDGVYTDPFEEDGTKHAIIYREKTNEPPKDVTAKTLKKHRAAKKKREQQLPTDNNQELNTEQYMNKKLIRLTEQDLHKIVKESVDKILKEMDLNPRMNMNTFDAHGRGLTSKSHTPNSPRRRATIKQQNLGGVNVDAVNKVLYPNQTPQMAKDQLKRKLYGESVNNAAVRREKMLQKYGRFNDGSDNPYSDEGRYYKHLETEPQGIEEGRYYNPRTYERDESKEFTHDEIKKLVLILKENPIEEMWKPYDLGWCKVQRVEANQTSGRSYLMSDPHNMTAPQDMYSDGNNGTIYLQIGRMPNTHWLDESGYTYMCWKW